MKRPAVAKTARMRVKVLGASALVLLLAACGDHPPKDDDDDDQPPAQAAISIVAGSATESGSTNATGEAARFNGPTGIAIDAAGNLYVADTGNDAIRKITPAGAVSTLAGAPGTSQYVDGPGDRARFVQPLALAINSSGTLFVTDEMRIRSVSSAGQVATVATIPVGSNVTAGSLPVLVPKGIAADARDHILVTNGVSTRRIVAGATGMLEGVEVAQDLIGTRTAEARGVAVDSNNNVYVFVLQRRISRSFNPLTVNANVLTPLAGAPNGRGAVNGSGTAATFEEVVALTVDPQGNVYASDAVNNLVRKITPEGVVTTLAGTTRKDTLQPGNLPGSLAPIRGITNDGKGNLYLTSGHAVIKIRLP
jgi:serine/threonine protein kinase, bacterial